MGRRKKEKSLQIEKKEAVMTEVLDAPVIESDEIKLEAVQTEIDLARQELERTKHEIEERKHQLELMKVTPSRHIDEAERKLIDKQVGITSAKTTLSEKIEKQKAFDSVMITGRFMNRRAPGQAAKLTYLKYDTDPVKWWVLEDGKTYTIPRGFADQLNGGTDEDPCYYTPKFNQVQGEMDPNKPDSAIHSVDSSNKKYGFVPLNF